MNDFMIQNVSSFSGVGLNRHHGWFGTQPREILYSLSPRKSPLYLAFPCQGFHQQIVQLLISFQIFAEIGIFRKKYYEIEICTMWSYIINISEVECHSRSIILGKVKKSSTWKFHEYTLCAKLGICKR